MRIHLLWYAVVSHLGSCCNNFSLQNLYWADSGDLVTIASDTSFYILKYNVRLYDIWHYIRIILHATSHLYLRRPCSCWFGILTIGDNFILSIMENFLFCRGMLFLLILKAESQWMSKVLRMPLSCFTRLMSAFELGYGSETVSFTITLRGD